MNSIAAPSAVLRRWPAVGAFIMALFVTGCAASAAAPEVKQVRPASAAPGDFVVLSGQRFNRGDSLWLNDRRLRDVTWVNDELMTAVLPADVPAGEYQLELRSVGGASTVTAFAVRDRAPAVAAPPARQPTATATAERAPSPAMVQQTAIPATRPPATVAPPAATTARPLPPPRGDDDDDDRDSGNKDKDKDKNDPPGRSDRPGRPSNR